MLKAFKWPQVDLAEQAFKNSIEDAPNPTVVDDHDGDSSNAMGFIVVKKGTSIGFSESIDGQFIDSVSNGTILESAPPCQNISGFCPSPHLVPDTVYQKFLFYMYQIKGKTDRFLLTQIEGIIHPESGQDHAALVAAYMYLKGQNSYMERVRNIIARHQTELATFKRLDTECFPIKRPRPSIANS